MFSAEPASAVDPTREFTVVCGGAGAIGSAVVSRLSTQGTCIIAVDRHFGPESTDTSMVTRISADLADERQVDRLVEQVERLGVPTRLILVHGGAQRNEVEASALEISADVFRRTLDDNLLSTYLVISRFARIMASRFSVRSIVVASSINASTALGYPAYSSAKAGVEAVVRCLAPALAARRIRLNAVALGTVWSNDRSTLHSADPDHLPAMTALSSTGTVMDPETAARAILDVADGLAPMYGSTIVVDYGQALNFPAIDTRADSGR